MKNIITLLVALCLVPGSLFAADSSHPEFLEDAQKEIVKISQNGFEPSRIKLTKEDASVFFLNNTKDALITIAIDYKNKKTHCASPNLKLGEDGYLRSISPIGPKDFALSCFPSKGEYQVSALGVRPDGKPVTGTIVVE